jgi:hypothetical protein
LTPSQNNIDYCKATKGDIGLLCSLLLGCNGSGLGSKAAFVHVLVKHSLFPLLIQRFFQLVARESMGTLDGKELGRYVRSILADIADVAGKLRPEFYLVMCQNNNHNVFSSSAIPHMLRVEGVTSTDNLCELLAGWIDGPAAVRFFKDEYE